MLKQTNIKFKRRLTVAGLVAAAVSVIVPVASASAWGPERTTYTMNNPADKVTFNSITDNNVVGDERNFVRVGEVGSGNALSDSVKVVPGKEYQVWIFYHNNAKTSMNADASGYARDVYVKSGLSTWTINSSKSSKVTGVISSSNADPLEVWDNAYFTTDSSADVILKYVQGSAKIYNQGALNGTTLPSNLMENGVAIGYNKLSGILPGCEEYSGHIVYNIRAEQVGAKVEKTVSKDGANFSESVDAKPGDTLTYKVVFTNTGTTDLTNVTFHDKLPEGVALVAGTTKLVNAANPNGLTMKDIIGANGFNTGLYGKGTTATITYQVKLNNNVVDGIKCGTKKAFKNTIYVDHDAGEINDSSTIYVSTNECTDEPDKGCDENDKDCICKESPNNPICTPEEPETPNEPELPKTGPGEIALAIVAVVCIATGGVYWYRSQKDLMKIEKSLDKTKK